MYSMRPQETIFCDVEDLKKLYKFCNVRDLDKICCVMYFMKSRKTIHFLSCTRPRETLLRNV